MYGSRKIKAALELQGRIVSKRRICRITKQLGLTSAYSRKKKPVDLSPKVNQAQIANSLNRQFSRQPLHTVLVCELTYVRIGGTWQYLCILLDLHNREIVGHSVGRRKDAQLVKEAFASVRFPLTQVQLFHSDRGREFDNCELDELLAGFDISRSLSARAYPYDNAVAEATFKLIKTEFIYQQHFPDVASFSLLITDYIHWFNHWRLHSSLGYLSPVQFRLRSSSFLSSFLLTIQTHLALGIGFAACEKGYEVRFHNIAQLAVKLMNAYKAETLESAMKELSKAHLLILDEWGYLPLDRESAQLLFRVIAESYEQRSVILTTNLEFSKWGGIFMDDQMTAAMIDRLAHHGHLLLFEGESYRMRHALMVQG